jgi:hypothetical protein
MLEMKRPAVSSQMFRVYEPGDCPPMTQRVSRLAMWVARGDVQATRVQFCKHVQIVLSARVQSHFYP